MQLLGQYLRNPGENQQEPVCTEDCVNYSLALYGLVGPVQTLHASLRNAIGAASDRDEDTKAKEGQVTHPRLNSQAMRA